MHISPIKLSNFISNIYESFSKTYVKPKQHKTKNILTAFICKSKACYLNN